MASYLDKTGLTYFWNKIKTYVTNAVKVTGVKGAAENSYRTGNVNVTAANVGAVDKSGDTMTGTLTMPMTRIGDTIYGVAYGYYSGTSKEIILFTGLKWRSSNYMPTVTMNGHAYGVASPVSLRMGFYIYQDVPYAYGIVNTGAWNPDAYIFKYTKNEETYVAIGLKKDLYFPNLSFDFQTDWPGTWTSGNVSLQKSDWVLEFYSDTGHIPEVDDATTNCKKFTYKVDILNPPKVNGHTVAKDVPSNAVFTDTTYSNATTSAAGLMSASDKTKLNGIATGAEVNQNAFSNVKVGSTTVSADAKTDTLELVAGSNITLTPDSTNDKVTISATDTTYSNATTSSAGLMSSTDKTKLDGIASGAEVNAVTDVKVNGSSVLSNKVASVTVKDGFGQFQIKNAGGSISQQDIDAGLNPGSSFYIKEGSNVTLTVDTTSAVPGITIAATDTTYSEATQSTAGLMSAADKTALDSLAGGTVSDVQVNGTSVVSNSVANIPLASSSANGVMSSSQYTKLDGIEAGAEVNAVTDVQLNGTSILSNGVANIPPASSTSNGYMSSAASKNLSSLRYILSATTSTAAATAEKVLTVSPTSFGISDGTLLLVKSTNTNSATNPKFKLGSSSTAPSHAVYYNNSAATGNKAGMANRLSLYIYYNNVWNWIGWSYDQDTQYPTATTSANGLMSSSDKTKLNGIDTGAEVNQAAYSYVRATHSNGTDYIQWPANSKTEVFYVKEGSNIAFSQDDYTGELVISATDTTYSAATTSIDGLMSSADKTKLNGIDTGAEVNQNAFSTVTVGNTDISAGTSKDAVEFVAGTNVTITPDATDKTVTISATDTTYSTMSSSDIVTGTSTTPMVATPKAIHDAIESMINTALTNVLTVTTS